MNLPKDKLEFLNNEVYLIFIYIYIKFLTTPPCSWPKKLRPSSTHYASEHVTCVFKSVWFTYVGHFASLPSGEKRLLPYGQTSPVQVKLTWLLPTCLGLQEHIAPSALLCPNHLLVAKLLRHLLTHLHISAWWVAFSG